MFLRLLLQSTLLISYLIGGYKFDIKGAENEYSFKQWATIPHSAIIYDADSIWTARIQVKTKINARDDHKYWIYTGIGLQFETHDNEYCCRCYFERNAAERTFARIYPPSAPNRYRVEDEFPDRFQDNLFSLIIDLIQHLWKNQPLQQAQHNSKYAISLFREHEVELKYGNKIDKNKVELQLYPLDHAPVPAHKFGWLEWQKRSDEGDGDETDYGQQQHQNMKIQPNQDGTNALDIFDAYDFRIFSRSSSKQKGWRVSEFLDVSEWDYFEHIGGLRWKREHYVDPQLTNEHAFYQEWTIEFNHDDDGSFKGFQEGPVRPFPLHSTKSHGPDETGVYKSHQWLLGDCQMHGMNAVLRGPFFKNTDLQSFGTPVGLWKYMWGTRRDYVKVLGLAHGFSNTVIKKALNTVGCDFEVIKPNDLEFVRDRKFMKYGKRANGDPMFLGFIFQYYASRRKEKNDHAIGWVYKPEGPDGHEGFWWVQSWLGYNRRWYHIANAYNRLNKWKTGTIKGYWDTSLFKGGGTKIYKWHDLLAVYIKDEDLYDRTLQQKMKKIAWKLQYGGWFEANSNNNNEANIVDENMYYNDDDVDKGYDGVYERDTYYDEYNKWYEQDELIDDEPFYRVKTNGKYN